VSPATLADPPVEVFAALGDPTRWQILALVAAAPRSASALSRALPISRTAVLKHLDVLGRSDLVRRHRVGREVRYLLHPEQLTETGRWMSDLAASWDARLTRLKRLAEEGGDDHA
jgi:DNA-binding transcriptional ArsR family regulator